MNRRITAGLWYALAGMIPGLLFIGGKMPFLIWTPAKIAGRVDDIYFVFVFLPACAGFISGALWAEKSGEVAKDVPVSNWIERGLVVALFAHVTFALLWAQWDGMLWEYGSGPYLFHTLFYGLLWFGWLEAVLGIGASWMLGIFRKRQEAREGLLGMRRLPPLSLPLRVLLWVLTLLIIAGVYLMEYLHLRR